MTNTASDNLAAAQTMIGLLSKQITIFDQLSLLAAKQRNLVSVEDTRPLLAVLAQRQRLTAALTELTARLKPYRNAWPTLRQSLTAQDRDTADNLIRQVNDRFQQLISGDEQDMQKLAVRMKQVGKKMQSVNNGRHAMQMYGAAVSGSANSGVSSLSVTDQQA